MSRLKETLKRPVRVAGLLELRYLRAHVDELEESFTENARHERMLAADLDRIEAATALVAARRAGARDKDHPAP